MGFVLGDMGRHEEARDATQARDPAQPVAVARAGEPLARPLRRRATTRSSSPQRQSARSAQMEVSTRRTARALQPRPRVPAEGLLRRGAARVSARARARRGARRSCCRRWPRCTCSSAMPAAARRALRRCSLDAARQPKLWNERGVALHQDGQLRRGGGELSARARASIRRTRIAHNNLGVALYHAATPRTRSRRSARRSTRSRRSSKARLNLALLLVQAEAAASLRSRRTARCCSVEPEQPVAWNGIGLVLAELQEVRGCAQRVRARDPGAARLSPRRTTT